MTCFSRLLSVYAPLRRVFDYAAVSKEDLPVCPGCGCDAQKNTVPFCAFDRYGYPAQTMWCQSCDMLFLSPRPTAQAYGNLYDEGSYRKLIAAFSGKADEHALPQKRVVRLGEILKETVKDKGVSVLNIGGTRADYDVLKTTVTLKDYLCLNPGAEEAGEGYRVEKNTLEDFSGKGQTFDLICLFGTLNHLLWPLEAFQKIASLLAPEGLFVFDYKDPIEKMRRMTHPSGALQFDHTVYPTQRTLSLMLERSGLTLCRRDTDEGRVFFFIASLAKEGAVVPVPSSQREALSFLKKKAGRIPLGLLLRMAKSFIGKPV